ncbi:MAG TPA: IPT/TIG domain-containing protein [Thermoanaerobaculia bacterium]|jgi:hypothetical protein|nr:IPT/TIG domain-containing protein [Thermoanaerobaculia bacterium]
MRRTLYWVLLLAISSAAIAETAPKIKGVSRNFGAVGGGTLLTFDGDNLLPTVDCLLPCPTTIFFGNVQGSLKAGSRTLLRALTPPAQAASTVDVTITVAGHAPIVLPNAFTYTTDPQANYEAVMLPLYFDGVLPGAHGSEWTTSLWALNNGTDDVRIAPWTCAAGSVCAAAYPWTYSLGAKKSLRELSPLAANDGNPSRMLYLSQAGADEVSFSLRFADRSRGLIDAGIDLPVIREREALHGNAHLFSVPLNGSFRVMLRLYEMREASARFRVTIYPQSELDELPIHIEEIATTVADGAFPEKAGYAQLDVTALLRLEKTWPATVRIEITPLTEGSRFWSFASVTSNDTQIVTLVTPQ